MSNPDRLTGLDSAFLHLEDHGSAHMHVASVMVFEGKAPKYEDFVEHILSRLHLVPRYRQRLAFVPLGQGRPVWTDDPHFNPRYHIRHTGLPRPEDETELKQLAGRIFSQRLDRSKPLWELWLVAHMAGERFAVIAKTHHALVDGISGVDITTVLFDASPEPAGTPRPPVPWVARPLPGPAKLLADALVERSTAPAEMVRGARAMHAPTATRARARQGRGRRGGCHDARRHQRAGAAESAQRGHNLPPSLHVGRRRPGAVQGDQGLARGHAQRRRAGRREPRAGTPHAHPGPRHRGPRAEGDGARVGARRRRPRCPPPALGNRSRRCGRRCRSGVVDPVECLAEVRLEMDDLKHSGQAVGAEVLTNLAGFAPPTILSQAARLQARQRFFNLVVTNVPGPQFPLYLLGRRLKALYPVVPLARRQALGIAVMSYDGRLGFGLLADYDALPELETIARELERAIAALADGGRRERPSARRPQGAPSASGGSALVTQAGRR